MKQDSDLILNTRGQMYHLALGEDMVAPICITVGDPERVAQVSNYFDRIDFKISNREFITHTGTLNQARIMVISTGISTDNIDIVFNELDALVNIDLSTKTTKKNFTRIKFIRIGTSGTYDRTIPVDSMIINPIAFGLDSLMRFYPNEVKYPDPQWTEALDPGFKILFKDAYLGIADQGLYQYFAKDHFQGVTITCPGFYGPQGRKLRLETLYAQDLIHKLSSLKYDGYQFTNFEMETAGIYGLARALGHQAVSINIILGNRVTGTFSKNSNAAIEHGIQHTMNQLAGLIRSNLI